MSGSNQTPFAGLTAAGVVLVKTISLFSLFAGSPQGQLQGQAGSPSLAPDMVWDYLGAALWICTGTGTSPSSTTWTQIQFTTQASFTNLTISEGFTSQTGNVVGTLTVGSISCQGEIDGVNFVASGNITAANGVVNTKTLTVSANATVGGTFGVTGTSLFTGVATFTAGPIFNGQANLNAGALLANSTALRWRNTGGTPQSILIYNTNNATVLTNGGSTIFFTRADGSTILGNIDNNGTYTSRTGTGSLRNTIIIAPEGNGVTVTGAAGTAAVTSYVSNILNTSSFHDTFLVGGTTAGSISSPTSSSVAFNTTSDHRIKEIDGLMAMSGIIIDNVPVYWGHIKGHDDRKYPFFLAHELQLYAGWAVSGKKDEVALEDHEGLHQKKGDPILQQVSHSDLVALLWAEVQSLRAVLKRHGLLT